MNQLKSRTAKRWRTAIATAGILLVSISTVQPAFASTDPTPPTPKASASRVANLAGHKTKRICAAPTHPTEMACHSVVDLDIMTPMATTGVPSGYGATDLKSAYAIPTDTSGVKKTVAVVTAYDAVNAEADLGVYRAKFGLPACTTANGCFTKVGQDGTANLPVADDSWAQETSLDLDMVSAACPTCNVLVVEANSPYLSDLGPSVNTAVQMGAIAVSNSYGGAEGFSPTQYEQYYTHPGVAITASAGDNGYGVNYPAASQYVTAVGGTSLHANSSVSRGWSEQVWGSATSGASGTGSGCSVYNMKPSWQSDNNCSTRTVADLSAVADPATGVAAYDSTSGGWLVFGGTSVASPLVAGMFATAGKPTANTFPSSYAYSVPSAVNDATSGTNGVCTIAAYFCTGVTGYDGPTGLGSPRGAAALTDLGGKFADAEAAANFGQETSQIICSADGSCTKTYDGGKIKWTYANGMVSIPNVVTPVPGPTPTPTPTPTTPTPVVAPTPIQDKWNSLQGEFGRLGNPLGTEVTGLVNGGSMQKYEHGSIYYTQATGAHVIEGPIGTKWTAAGAQNSALGYPTADTVTGLKISGATQSFAKGSIAYSPTTGAHFYGGGIGGKWIAAGAQNGKLGYPISDELAGANGGVYQKYQNASIYWSSTSGAHIAGWGIGGKWVSTGAERGPLGYPTSDELAGPRYGAYQTFQHGSIYWSSTTSAQTVLGGIYTKWMSLGGASGRLGYPSSGEYAYGGGVRQNFQHGYVTYTSRTGVVVH